MLTRVLPSDDSAVPGFSVWIMDKSLTMSEDMGAGMTDRAVVIVSVGAADGSVVIKPPGSMRDPLRYLGGKTMLMTVPT